MGKLWAWFLTAIVIVAGLNYWIVVKEPPEVDLNDLTTHFQEAVRVEGTLLSYTVDPYDEGADRIDFIIAQGDQTIRVRWYGATDLPSEGSKLKVVGEVVSKRGRIWIQCDGVNAVEVLQLASITNVELDELADNPAIWKNKAIRIKGWLRYPLSPEAYSSYLEDSDYYKTVGHTLPLILQGDRDYWLDDATEVEMVGIVNWNKGKYRWELEAQSSSIRVLTEPEPEEWDWGWNIWSYDIGNRISIEGYVEQSDDGWWLEDTTSGMRVCLLPGGGEIPGETQTLIGRIAWDEKEPRLCLDRGG